MLSSVGYVLQFPFLTSFTKSPADATALSLTNELLYSNEATLLRRGSLPYMALTAGGQGGRLET